MLAFIQIVTTCSVLFILGFGWIVGGPPKSDSAKLACLLAHLMGLGLVAFVWCL